MTPRTISFGVHQRYMTSSKERTYKMTDHNPPQTRNRLAQRRNSENLTLIWEGQQYELTIGFYDDGRIGEVFADSGKSPQTVQQLMSDACILISIALQHNVTVDSLLNSIPKHEGGKPYTVIGKILQLLNEGEEDRDEKI